MLIAAITVMAADLREGFAVTAAAPLAAQVEVAGTQIVGGGGGPTRRTG